MDPANHTVSGTKTRFLEVIDLYSHIHTYFGPIDLKIGPVAQHTSLYNGAVLQLMKIIISHFFLTFSDFPLRFA